MNAAAFTEMVTRARQRWEQRQNPGKPLVLVNLGTSALFAGARRVKAAFTDACREAGVEVEFRPVGGFGFSFLEPQLDIIKPGRPRIMYGPLTPETARELVFSYLVNDDPRPDLAFVAFGDQPFRGIPCTAEHPLFTKQVRLTMRLAGTVQPDDIDDYLANDGYAGLARALTMDPSEVIEWVTKSGLRGCGGAAFPTGVKWNFNRAPAPEKYFLCNADEGNAGTFKDRLLMEGTPHQLVEGMIIGAYAQRIPYGYIYIRDEYPLATHLVSRAIEQAYGYGLLGENILGSGFSFHLGVKEGAGSYLCGEESAMIASVEGSRGMPRARPPFPAQAGAWLKPTTVNNVETICNVPNIIRNGWEAYAAIGTEKSKGVRVLTLSGACSRPGGYEVPFGMTFRELIVELAGGDPAQIKAVQMGGPATDIRPLAYILDLPIALDELRPKDTGIGSGGFVLIPHSTSIPELVKHLCEFLRDESCGKCFPCRYGTQRQYELMDWISRGNGSPLDLRELEKLFPTLQFGSLCGHGQVAHQPVKYALLHFRGEFERLLTR
ncbi:MAG: NADH-quinone oxidoreductase subunit F [Chloroflexi bacterium]|nr:NADH-quinone oxidoreductase subunit F [Chloroflexota bacterium]